MNSFFLIFLYSFIFDYVDSTASIYRSRLTNALIPRSAPKRFLSSSSIPEQEPKFYKSTGMCSFLAIVCMASICEVECCEKSNIKTSSLPLNVHLGFFCIAKTETDPSGKTLCDSCGCGEDSFCFNVSSDVSFLGIADGVGGSRRTGGNPALFAQTLMEKSLDAFEYHKFDEERVASKIVNDAFEDLVQDFSKRSIVPFGSSTVCVALVDSNSGKVKFVNVGDSGLIVLSPEIDDSGFYRIKYQTRPLQYRFNCPYQLKLSANLEKFNPTDESDTEESFEETKNLCLKSGDILLLVTDGVLDNLFPDKIEELVDSVVHSAQSAEQIPRIIAKTLSFEARKASIDETASCPFNVAKHVQTGNLRSGGKVDDITVLAVLVKSKNI